MSIAIIDYGSGNLHSAAKSFERAAREAGLNTPVLVTSDPDQVRQADRIVLPGVGAFADCRKGLDGVPGMVEVLVEQVRQKAVPFLGICVGMQLMASRGLEYQITPGLGWIAGDVKLIEPESGPYKVPHMGWNTLHPQREHALLDGIETGPQGLHAYFVHSYALVAKEAGDVLAYTNHGGPVTAIVAHGNMAGTQFHPEKSQKLGLKFITNFLKWAP